MSASDYTEANILQASLRGVAYPLPTGTYVSLHTADPGDTGVSEVSTGAWPGYVRRHAENGAAIGTGWTAPVGGISSNAKQITYPVQDGVSNVTVTHFAVWDALAAGNCIGIGALTASRTLANGDILVFDIGSLVITAT